MSARSCGAVVRTAGEMIVAALPGACVGDGVSVVARGGRTVAGTVAAVERGLASIAAYESVAGIAAGDRAYVDDDATCGVIGYALLGRAVDARGRPLDGEGPPRGALRHIGLRAPLPAERAPVDVPFWTGVPALDGLLTIGRGARVGLFGAPGCGKSTLLESICAGAVADAVVLALIGERGREAQSWFTRRDRRTSIVCATSDRGAAERVRAAHLAMAHACALRDRGLHVLLVVDSLARFCTAERERRSALGEPPGRGGYPAAVWAELARFLECGGNARGGSITAIVTVLADGGDEREPLSDNARSLLDGHIVLSSALARAGRFPAIDVCASASRTMSTVATREHRLAASVVREALARLAASEEARSLGLQSAPSPALAAAIAAEDDIVAFLRRESAPPPATLSGLSELAGRLAETAMAPAVPRL